MRGVAECVYIAHMSKAAHLSSAEAAAALGVSTSTINRMVADGQLKPYLKLPGKTGAYVFTQAEVDRAAKAFLTVKTVRRSA